MGWVGCGGSKNLSSTHYLRGEILHLHPWVGPRAVKFPAWLPYLRGSMHARKLVHHTFCFNYYFSGFSCWVSLLPPFFFERCLLSLSCVTFFNEHPSATAHRWSHGHSPAPESTGGILHPHRPVVAPPSTPHQWVGLPSLDKRCWILIWLLVHFWVCHEGYNLSEDIFFFLYTCFTNYYSLRSEL